MAVSQISILFATLFVFFITGSYSQSTLHSSQFPFCPQNILISSASDIQCPLDFMTTTVPYLPVFVSYSTRAAASLSSLFFFNKPTTFPQDKPSEINVILTNKNEKSCPLLTGFSTPDDPYRAMVFPHHKLLLTEPIFQQNGIRSIHDFARLQIIPCFVVNLDLNSPQLFGFVTRTPLDPSHVSRNNSGNNIDAAEPEFYQLENYSLYLYAIRPYYPSPIFDAIDCSGETPDKSSEIGGFFIFDSEDIWIADAAYAMIQPKQDYFSSIEINYIVDAIFTATTSRINPRIDLIVLSFTNFEQHTMHDFTIAFDTTGQPRIDRSYMLSASTMEAIKQYWMTSNHLDNAPAQCQDSDAKIVIRQINNDSAVFTVAFGQNTTSAQCNIPVPIHLIHYGLADASYLDYGTWNNTQMAIYVQLDPNEPEMRLFRHHTAEPRAKWNFFDPHLAPFVKMQTEHKYDENDHHLSLNYNFTIFGPEPEIIFSDNHYPSNNMFSRFFNQTDDNEGYFHSWMYIINPIDFRSPKKHKYFRPSEISPSLPLFIDDYNGYLKMSLSFKIPHSQLQNFKPFRFELLINQQPHFISLLPDLEPRYTFTEQFDQYFKIEYRVKQAKSTRIGSYTLNFSDSDSAYVPLTIGLQHRFKPFDLSPSQTQKKSNPDCHGRILDKNDIEIPPPIKPEFSIKKNDLLATIFSPTKSTSHQFKVMISQ